MTSLTPRPVRSCEVCGNQFELPPTAENKRYCSKECRLEWHKQHRRRAFEALEAQEAAKPRETSK